MGAFSNMDYELQNSEAMREGDALSHCVGKSDRYRPQT